jgi:microcin C transport system permease protein
MRDYFLRRFLLIPPTLLGITLIVFLITRVVPGGPLERSLIEAQMGDMGGGRADTGRGAISEEQMAQLKAYYGFDQPPVTAYLLWLKKIVTGDFGMSYRFNEPVLQIILERVPVSLTYGFITLLPGLRCLHTAGCDQGHQAPHANRQHHFRPVFTGYAIPGYALGAILVVYLAARCGWFPMGGFTSKAISMTSACFGKLGDFAHHAALPLFCYTVGSFALVTLLMKNHLMDNLAADFIRTAVAKGVSFRAAVVKHALRNSLIPIATHLGQHFTLLVTGSFLIEFIFDINGMGLLGYTSVVDRDYPTVMGVLLISSMLILIGHIVSDVLVAIIDPRVRFK